MLNASVLSGLSLPLYAPVSPFQMISFTCFKVSFDVAKPLYPPGFKPVTYILLQEDFSTAAYCYPKNHESKEQAMALTRRQFLTTGIGAGVAMGAIATVRSASTSFAAEPPSGIQQISAAEPLEDGTYGNILSAMAVISDTHIGKPLLDHG